jgi:large repetitive protein
MTTEVTVSLLQDKTVQVTVTDLNGCQQTEIYNFDIAQSGQISGGCGEPYCITFNTNGFPNAPFTFEWYLNGAKLPNNESRLCNLSKGLYKVIVTDDKGCIFEKEFDIPEVTKAIEVTYTVVPEQNFKQSKDGAIEVNTSAVAAPFDYYITNYSDFHTNATNTSDKALNFKDLYAGIYELSIKSADGCTKRFFIEVFYCDKYIPDIDLKMIDVTKEQVTNNPQYCSNKVWGASFNLKNIGEASLNIKGGKAPYSYVFTKKVGMPKGQGTLDDDNDEVTFNNLGAGAYTLLIKDSESCYKKYDISIIENPDKGTHATNDKFWEIKQIITPISAFCTGGAIKLSNAGAFGKNTTFDWTGPNGFKADTKDLKNLTVEGTYSVLIRYEDCDKGRTRDFVVGKSKNKVKNTINNCEGCIEFTDTELDKWQNLVITYAN